MKKIIDAFIALARAVPDLDAVEIATVSDGRPWVQMGFRSDEGVLAAAKALSINIERAVISCGTHWLTGDDDNDERMIHVSGPHHRPAEIEEPDSDSATIAAALAQAEEAVRQ